MRWSILLWLIASLVLVAAPCFAAPRKTVAVHVEGAQAAAYRERIVDAVPGDRFEVLEESQLKAALRQAGLPGAMGQAITGKGMRPALFKAVRRAMKTTGAEATVLARVVDKRGGKTLHIVWVPPEGDALVDEEVVMSGERTAEVKAIAEVIGPELDALSPPPPPKPEPEPKAIAGDSDELGDEDEDDGEDDKGGFRANRPGYELFALEVGAQLNGRFFSYSDSPANTPNTRPYDVFGVPSLRLAGEVYPAAMFDVPVLRDIGIGARFFYAFGLESQTEDAQYLYDTSWSSFRVGLRYRVRLPPPGGNDDKPIVLALSGSYGRTSFTFEPVMENGPSILHEIATVEYQTLRGGLDGRVPIGRVAIVAGAGFSGALDGGELYDRFRDAFLAAFDVELGLVIVLAEGFETRVAGEYERYFSSFEPVPGDMYVAGGALDQLVAVRVGVGYVF